MTGATDANSNGDKLHEVYVAQVRNDAIRLIYLGYRRLSAASFASAEEDDITGELVREIRLVIQDVSSPEWVDRYNVREQVPQNVSDKRGKRRPKVDIELERNGRGTRPRIGFEAKRLGGRYTIDRYLDEDLGAFVSGYYPTTHGEAGMLGYIQSNANEHWSGMLADALSLESEKHRMASHCKLEKYDLEPEMPAFRSDHIDSKNDPLLIVHVLLRFC